MPIHHDQDMITLADIARHFSLPESTARYYCKRFAPFMPSTGEGRRRRYHTQALEVIAAILEHMRTSRTAAQVEQVLSRDFSRTMDAVVPVRNAAPQTIRSAPALTGPPLTGMLNHEAFASFALQLLEQQSKATESIAASLHILAMREKEIERLSQQAQDTAAENATLRKELANMRIALDSNEKLQQADLDQVRTWVGRILRTRTQAVAQ